MKKSFNIIITFLVIFTSFFAFPRSSRAEDRLTIAEWMVDAELLENGDLHIIEDISFDFQDEFNGVFRDVVLDKTSGIADVRVQELAGRSPVDYTRVEKAKNGDAGVFQLNEGDNKLGIKIFSPSDEEQKTFRLSYTVKNVAIKYNDIGELYYKFLGDENETPIDSFKVYIRLPHEAGEDQVKVFAHGPLNGKINRVNNSTYSLHVDRVPSNTFIESRLVFPTEFIPNSRNIQSIDSLSRILDEEAAFQQKLQADQERRERYKGIFDQASIILSGLCAVLFVAFLSSFRREKNVYHNGGFNMHGIPDDCTPAIASYLVSAMVNTNMIFATILDLMRKGFLTLSKDEDQNTEGKKRKRAELESFLLIKTKDADDSLLSHERHFLSWMFDHMGDGKKVSNTDIEDYHKHHASAFFKNYSEWSKRIKEDAIEKGYYDRSKAGYGAISMVSSVIAFVIGIIALVYGGFYGVLCLIVGTALFIYGITLFFRRSDYGHQQYSMWREFTKHMKQYKLDLDLENLNESAPDVSLIYGLALGVNKKLKDFNLDRVSDERTYYSNNWFFWYLIFHDQNSTLHRSLNKSFTGSASTSSSSGSFSGGGGGGAGGGGAGGF